MGGALRDVTLAATPTSIHGLPGPHGAEEPVDLDADGDRDVVVDAIDGLHVVELPGLRSVWHVAAQGTLSGVTVWNGAPVAFSHMDVLASPVERVFAADAAHTVLVETRREDRHLRVRPGIDPAGDGSLLALDLAGRSGLLAAGEGAAVAELEITFASSGDPAEPWVRPARFAGGSGAELAGVHMARLGSPAMGGSEDSEYEVRLLPPPGRGAGRTIRSARTPGEGWPAVRVLDLERDGRSELLIDETGSYMNCDIESGGGGSSKWVLIAGDGTVLWEDETRYFEFGSGYRRDEQAQVAVVELSAGGMLGLRFRTSAEEWWVLPSSFGGAPPPCLE